jgi:hypothetical protein
MNIDLVVLSIWNLLTLNSLIELSPDFNWTTQIVEHEIYCNASFPLNTCSPWALVCPGRVPALQLTSISVANERYLKYFVEIILK